MKTVVNLDCCCGCGQCAEICPSDAIKMEKNEQGFFYPVVSHEKCLECGRCIKSCAFNTLQDRLLDSTVIEAFAAKHKNNEVRMNSRSGGVFTALSDWILEQEGIVYGCELIDCRRAVHKRAITKEERDKFRGSKYIQSEIFDCYKKIKNDLKSDKYVLFSGTPCQVNAIKSYCYRIDTSKLFLIDIVCHGVPSPLVWSDYLDFLSNRKKTIVSVDFRDKKRFGWSEHKETVFFNNGDVYSGEVFKRLFYSHYILRKDCFDCPFKNLNRTGDVTIADCWGIAENYPEFDDDKGVSLVLINSAKGRRLIADISRKMETLEVDIDKLLQPALKKNWTIPNDYESFWRFFNHHSFQRVVKKYVYKLPPLYIRIDNRVKRTSMVGLKKIRSIIKNKL